MVVTEFQIDVEGGDSGVFEELPEIVFISLEVKISNINRSILIPSLSTSSLLLEPPLTSTSIPSRLKISLLPLITVLHWPFTITLIKKLPFLVKNNWGGFSLLHLKLWLLLIPAFLPVDKTGLSLLSFIITLAAT